MKLCPLFLLLITAGCAANPTVVDSDPATGFALYRSGWLASDHLESLCRAGVEEILILDGSAGERECRMRRETCPGLRILQPPKQDARIPVEAAFLALRCRHGWHRTGRLVAYYRLRFGRWSTERAIDEMLEVGRWMSRHPQLVPQVRAMAEFIAYLPCTEDPRDCVRHSADPEAPADRPLLKEACP